MLTSGPVLDKRHNVGLTEGFEAWRRFAMEHKPKWQSRTVGALLQVHENSSTTHSQPMPMQFGATPAKGNEEGKYDKGGKGKKGGESKSGKGKA